MRCVLVKRRDEKYLMDYEIHELRFADLMILNCKR